MTMKEPKNHKDLSKGHLRVEKLSKTIEGTSMPQQANKKSSKPIEISKGVEDRPRLDLDLKISKTSSKNIPIDQLKQTEGVKTIIRPLPSLDEKKNKVKSKGEKWSSFLINIMGNLGDMLLIVTIMSRWAKLIFSKFGFFLGAITSLLGFSISAYRQAFRSKSTMRSRLIKLTLSLVGWVLTVAGMVMFVFPVGGVLLAAASLILSIKSLYRVANAYRKFELKRKGFEKFGDKYKDYNECSNRQLRNEGWSNKKIDMKLELDRRSNKIKDRVLDLCTKLTGTTVTVTFLVFSMVGFAPMGLMAVLAVCALSSGLIETYNSNKELHYASFTCKGAFGHKPSKQVVEKDSILDPKENKTHSTNDTETSGRSFQNVVKKIPIFKKKK
jgi:hypothetical protein